MGADKQLIDWLRCLHLQGVNFPSEATGFAAYSVPYRLLAGAPGAPTGLTPKLVSLADLADRLQAEVEGGRSAKTLVDGSMFAAFFTTGSAFAKAFDEACLNRPRLLARLVSRIPCRARSDSPQWRLPEPEEGKSLAEFSDVRVT